MYKNNKKIYLNKDKMEYTNLKGKFNSYFNYVKNKFNNNDIAANVDKENYQIIERKRKIFYFSKFTLDLNEIYTIYETIRNIKENILKNLLDSIKYCGTGKYLNLYRIIKVFK